MTSEGSNWGFDGADGSDQVLEDSLAPLLRRLDEERRYSSTSHNDSQASSSAPQPEQRMKANSDELSKIDVAPKPMYSFQDGAAAAKSNVETFQAGYSHMSTEFQPRASLYTNLNGGQLIPGIAPPSSHDSEEKNTQVASSPTSISILANEPVSDDDVSSTTDSSSEQDQHLEVEMDSDVDLDELYGNGPYSIIPKGNGRDPGPATYTSPNSDSDEESDYIINNPEEGTSAVAHGEISNSQNPSFKETDDRIGPTGRLVYEGMPEEESDDDEPNAVARQMLDKWYEHEEADHEEDDGGEDDSGEDDSGVDDGEKDNCGDKRQKQKSKGVQPDAYKPFRPEISITPCAEVALLGIVENVISNVVLVQPPPPNNKSDAIRIIDAGSPVCLNTKKYIGSVVDVIGKTREPRYVVAFNNTQEIIDFGIGEGTDMYYFTQHAEFINIREIKEIKATDASDGEADDADDDDSLDEKRLPHKSRMESELSAVRGDRKKNARGTRSNRLHHPPRGVRGGVAYGRGAYGMSGPPSRSFESAQTVGSRGFVRGRGSIRGDTRGGHRGRGRGGQTAWSPYPSRYGSGFHPRTAPGYSPSGRSAIRYGDNPPAASSSSTVLNYGSDGDDDGPYKKLRRPEQSARPAFGIAGRGNPYTNTQSPQTPWQFPPPYGGFHNPQPLRNNASSSRGGHSHRGNGARDRVTSDGLRFGSREENTRNGWDSRWGRQ
ncbi:MAG: hypothetical protein M1820_001525 [Bogoriella megaspora]|nr:MAG: hypothetical protein M1820_001525 [Bogoriella megaspora]